jgi:metal-dependent amidase/aminoacylase/carboxypeptidase family protein
VVGTLIDFERGMLDDLRVDMDALPMAERSARAYASRHAGVHHGCRHAAMLFGACQRSPTSPQGWSFRFTHPVEKSCRRVSGRARP